MHCNLGKPIEAESIIQELQETNERAGEGINQNRGKNGKTGENNIRNNKKPQLKAHFCTTRNLLYQ
jgi:hypothetical protein